MGMLDEAGDGIVTLSVLATNRETEKPPSLFYLSSEKSNNDILLTNRRIRHIHSTPNNSNLTQISTEEDRQQFAVLQLYPEKSNDRLLSKQEDP